MISGRITQKTISDNALRGLQAGLERVGSLQNQLSSGRRIDTPSDDPAATATTMGLRTRRAQQEQYLRNIDQANGRITVTDNTLTALSDRLRAVRDMVIQARNGGSTNASLSAIAADARSVGHEVTDLYNTTYLDRPIFGGTVAGRAAIDAGGTYIGDDEPVETRISVDSTIRVDVPGQSIGADKVPDLLDQVATRIAAGTMGDSDIDALDAALSKVGEAQGDIGARAARIETVKNTVDGERLDLTARISENEDIDVPKTMMEFSAQQVGYQAALQAAAKIQQVSLMDFLK